MVSGRLSGILNNPDNLNRASRRNAKKYLKHEMQRVEHIRAADQMSGVGYPIDRQTRDFLKVANDDVFNGITPPHAKLWDVVNGFFQREPGEMVDFLRLRQEKDHAFNSVDFFAFATDPSLQEQSIPKLLELPEGLIHNFTALGNIKEVEFQENDGEPIVFSGISMVRWGEHLHWHTIGGPITDLEAVTAQRRGELAAQESTIRANNRHASEAMINDIMKPTAMPVPGTNDVWHCSALGLFNLRTQKHEMRMTAKEWRVSQAVFSDQFEQRFQAEYETNEAIRRMVDKSVAQLEKDHLFFEIAETAFILPAYFAAKVGFIAPQNMPTKLGDPNGGSARKYALKAPLDMRILTRTVSTLDFQRSGGFGHDYTPPRFRVEVDGFWRRLAPDSVGRDQKGEPMRGKTWVTAHARWKDKPPKIGIVHVKTAIISAFERANKLADRIGGEVTFKVT